MPNDPVYNPAIMIYESVGLSARPATDQAPLHSYLDNLNCLERAESNMSSRYGSVIINRDAVGSGTTNHLFSSPVTSLARLTYLGQSYRYAATSDGLLFRRLGDGQGAYTQITTGLSGMPFQSVITNCFLSSQPYLFVYDINQSIKDNGTLSAPQLTGIDPSPYTVNSQPYSPLLTLIDNFASTNTYASSGFSSAWAFSAIVTLISTGGDIVTDFPEFFGVQQTGSGSFGISGGTTTASVTNVGTSSGTSTYSGFSSSPVASTETVSLSVSLNGSINNGVHATGTGTITLSYSADGGATFNPFWSQTHSPGTSDIGGTITITVPGITNLISLQIKVDCDITTLSGSTLTTTTSAALTSIVAIVAAVNVFGPVANGMLTILGSSPSTAVPISSVVSNHLVGSTYDQLLVTTQSAHGRSAGNLISIYASTNDLVDGFYTVLATPTATTLTVSYISNVPLSSTGGTLWGGASTPATAVLINQYSTPYPTQMSAWGFYQQVPVGTTSFPVSSWVGTVAASSTATVGATVNLNLAQNNQVNDDDLIVITLAVSDPANISNIRLQFDVNASAYTSAYYYKDISPSYYQANIEQTESSYDATTQQIFADTISLVTGQQPNSTAAQLQPANFSTGQNAWIAIYMRRGDFLAVGNAGESGADWTAITGWQLVIATNATGSSDVAANGIYLQWGYGPSSFGGVGYDYRQTYYSASTGTESNPCPTQRFDKAFGYLSSLVAPFYLRQAARVIGQYSTDPQVTHVRIYRRGGIYSSSWFMIDQFPNATTIGQFTYKDVIPDSVLAQAQPLVLDNDPPVTSSLQHPIATTLSNPTAPPGISYYSPYSPQTILVVEESAEFVVDQVVDIGYATTLEQVRVITGGVGTFTAILRLQHNAGEPVNVYSIPRAKCNLCALAYDQIWLAGDINNPNYLYYSKRGRPENFGPQNYIKVGVSGDTIMAIVNWRGTLFVATNKTWFSIIGGAQPYPQPTGANHGVAAYGGWAQTESAIIFRAPDGLRIFTGAAGEYLSLPIEQIFRQNPSPPLTPVPLADPNETNQDVMGYYNNCLYDSYISTTNSGQRFRLAYDLNYRRFRYDDIGATAMLWEQDTNTFLVGKYIPGAGYAVVQDQVNDYDDGGWTGGSELIQLPIALRIQTPFNDLGKPHFPKQYNVLEGDYNTQSQPIQTSLIFNTEPPTTLALPAYTGNNLRNKKQFQITPSGSTVTGSGFQAYSMSLVHTMSVTVAPTFYQENIYATVLADYRTSFDTYWLKLSTDQSKIVKQIYVDYTASSTITVHLYADGSTLPYYTFTLPPNATRQVVRRLFCAWKPRTWRMIALCSGDFQFWNAPSVESRGIREGNTYSVTDLGGGQ